MEARTPRDTFQYTINREPYTPPIVIVSYNDPQGNHRFVVPPDAMALSHPTDDLMTYSGEMLQDPGVEIVTTGPVGATAALGLKSQADTRSLLKQAGLGVAVASQSVSTDLMYQPDNSLSGPASLTAANTLNLVVNNPTETTLTDAHLFLEFIDITGTVASEVPVTVTLPAGPTVVPVTWDTADFDPPYDPDQDYIVMAFLTDYQGNILDTAGRPLSSFQADPTPAFAMRDTDTLWDFGTAAQGTLLRRTVALGSVGYMDLLTYVERVSGLSISDAGGRRLPPGDVTLYDLTLNTAELPQGPFERTISIRTSDPEHPTRTLTIRGTITPMPPDSPGGATIRPLDWDAFIPGDHSQGEWVEFTHTLGPDPQSLHPVKVYSQDYTSLLGCGNVWSGADCNRAPGNQWTVEYTADALPLYSTPPWERSYGAPPGYESVENGVLRSGTPGTYTYNYYRQTASLSNETGTTLEARLKVVSGQPLSTGAIGNMISVFDNTRKIRLAIFPDGIKLADCDVCDEYQMDTTDNFHVYRLTLVGNTAKAYVDGVLRLSGTAVANSGQSEIWFGNDWMGAPDEGLWDYVRYYTGGAVVPLRDTGWMDLSLVNPGFETGNFSGWSNAVWPWSITTGYRHSGEYAATQTDDGGIGPDLYQDFDVSTWREWIDNGYGEVDIGMFSRTDRRDGGTRLTLRFMRDGQDLEVYQGDCVVHVWVFEASWLNKPIPAGTDTIRAQYGICKGWTQVDDAYARVRFQYPDYITEQVESAPYTTTRLNLPESFAGGRTYKVQYGRRYVFGGAGNWDTTLRVPAGAFTNATLDALVSSVGSGSLTFRLDIGNDSSWDWEWSGNVDSAATLNSPDLAAAFNEYWTSQGAPTSGAVDMPVKVYLSKGGQVILTNLVMTVPTGSKMRYVRLPAQDYSNVTLDFTVGKNLLFFDDFSTEVPGRWDKTHGTWQVTNGVFDAVGAGPGIDAWAYAGDETWTDYSLRTRINMISGNGEAVFRSTGHWQNEYRLSVFSASAPRYQNHLGLARYKNGVHTSLWSQTLPVQVPSTVDVQVGIVGDHIQVYLDGTKWIDLHDPDGLAAGRIGLGVIWDWHAQFDDVQVVSLSADNQADGEISSHLSIAADVGDDGTVDWTYSGSASYPTYFTTDNLASLFNAYLSSHSGEVDVPVRFYLAPFLPLDLDDFSAIPSARPDVTLEVGDIEFGVSVATAPAPGAESTGLKEQNQPKLAGSAQLTGLGSLSPMALASGEPTEGDTVPITATLHNAGPADSGPLTVAFFATPSGGLGETYIGSAFVPNVPAGGTANASIPWNTLGFTGDVPVRVVADPYGHVAETDEANNVVTTTLRILTRPDLRVPAIALSDPEPVAGQPVSVTLTISNASQTAAGVSTMALYDGNPDSGGTLLGDGSSAVPAEGVATLEFTWTPATPGPHRLFAVSDRDNAVSEFDEGNNQTWRDVYVGFAGPIELDSGGDPDPQYTPAQGYGYLDGQASTFCGTEPAQSLRSDADGEVQYRFDHLLPGHFYHLDITLYECDGLGRQESILVDGFEVTTQPESLIDGEVHELSVRLDPALYADRTITVGIQEAQGYDAVVAKVELHDIDYRYADAGGANDPPYAVGQDGILSYGWLDGVANMPWGTLPYQSRRIDLGDTNPGDDPDNELRYRFDGLDPSRRYQLHLTFYQKVGGFVQQSVAVDNVDTGAVVELDGEQRVDKTVDVPAGTYADGSIVVRITRTDGAAAGAFVNEIALEELTLGTTAAPGVEIQRIDLHAGWNWISFALEPNIERDTACTGVTPTSAFSSFTGDVLIDGQPAPVGTLVEAYSPRGDKVGCQAVSTAGVYPFLRVYGEEGSTPGMRAGEPIIFKVNGVPATPTSGSPIWQNDKDTHTVDLAASGLPPVEKVLATVSDVLEKLLCEVGTYLPLPANPVFNSCHTMQPGLGYLLRASGDATLTIEGDRVPADMPLDLDQGWNWIGYLPQCGLPVGTALASIDGQFDLLHGETGTYQPPPGNPANTLHQMAPGRGYMIRMTGPATLKYPADACGVATAQTAELPQTSEVSATACAATPTPFFTIFYGTATLGDRPYPAGTRIEALSPRGEVVGCGQVGEDGFYPFLRVYGADEGIPGMRAGEPVLFEVNGRLVELEKPALWENDRDVHRLDLRVEPAWGFLPLVVR